MARVAIIFGLILCGLTVTGLVTSTAKNATQFFAIMLGIPILFLGVVALNPHRRKHSMHVTAVIAALGVLLGAIRWMILAIRWAGGKEINGLTFTMLSAITVVCLALLVLCVISFVQGRRRNSGDSPQRVSDSKAVSKPGEAKKPELEASVARPD